MSTEQNKTIVRRFIEDAWGRGNAGLLDQIMATDVCDHMPAPGQPRGLEGQRWALEMFQRGVPDIRRRRFCRRLLDSRGHQHRRDDGHPAHRQTLLHVGL
jgi:hypothetical protein